MLLCTADMGFAAAKTYDIEVWLPSTRRVHGNFFLLEHRSIPGAPLRHPLQRKNRQKRIRAHAERLRPRRRTHLDRPGRKFSAGRRLNPHPRSLVPLHGSGPHPRNTEDLEEKCSRIKNQVDWADKDHRPGRLRHAARRLQRYRERFRRHSLRQFHRPGINRPAINHAGADGLAILGDQPQLVALVRRRRFHPPVAHGHAHFRVVHHAHVALGHAGLLRKRDGDRVLRFQQRLRVESFIELLLLLLQRGLLLSQLRLSRSFSLRRRAATKRSKMHAGTSTAAHHRPKNPPARSGSCCARRRFGAFDRRVNLAHQPLSHPRRRLHAGSGECEQEQFVRALPPVSWRTRRTWARAIRSQPSLRLPERRGRKGRSLPAELDVRS